MIERLAWDSDFFGYEVGKAEVGHMEEILRGSQNLDQYQLVYIFCNDQVRVQLPPNLVHLGTFVKFNKSIKNGSSAPIPPFISLEQDEGVYMFSGSRRHDGVGESLRRLALQSGKFSRFNLDNRLRRSEFERLYTAWIKKAVNGRERLLMFVKDSDIRGFITFRSRNNSGVIGLFAVEEAYRERGIGKLLLQAASQAAEAEGLERLEVATQKANVPAMALYRKSGFALFEEKEVFHWWG